MDAREARHIKTYVVSTRTHELLAGPWSQVHTVLVVVLWHRRVWSLHDWSLTAPHGLLLQANVEGGASMLAAVPAPLGGVLLVGERTVTYHSGQCDLCRFDMPARWWVASCLTAGSR